MSIKVADELRRPVVLGAAAALVVVTALVAGVLVLANRPASGGPTPGLATTSVATVRAGATGAPVTLAGTGFAAGISVTSPDYDTAIHSVVVVNPTTLTFTVTTFDGAALGPRRLTLKNTTGSAITCSCLTLTWPYHAAAKTRPNVIVINTDDQRYDSIPQMPQTAARTDWVHVTNSFVDEPECCPSRATTFTGQGIIRNGVSTLRDGGKMNDKTTIATMLHAAGYQTQMVGKYLNGYPFGPTPYTPPGWDDFRAFYGPDPTAPQDAHGNTVGYPYVNYRNVENLTVTTYKTAPQDYSTDRYAALARDFLRRSDPTRPIFTYLAPVAPHFTVRPADRDKGSCASTPLPLPLNFNSHDTVSEPGWMAALKGQATADMIAQRLGTCQTLQAVDAAVSSLFTELAASGRLDNTYVIYTSDNGYGFGEHRLAGKGDLYEESIRVPMLVRGPGIVPGTMDRLTVNTDLAPTIAAMAKITPPAGFFDGQSFLDNLQGTNTTPDPTSVLLFGCRTPSGPDAFCGGSLDFMGEAWGIRTAGYKYIWYAQTGEVQLFDEKADPLELRNLAADPGHQAVRANLAHKLATMTARSAVLRGRVTDAATGLPLVNINVHIETPAGSPLTDVWTDANGRYAALPLPLGGVKIRFDDPKAPHKWYGGSGSRSTATVVHLVGGTTEIDAALARLARPIKNHGSLSTSSTIVPRCCD